MRLHRNAALSWQGRRLLAGRVLEQGWTLRAAAAAAGVSVRCAGKWAARYREDGESGLFDRSSAPRRVANRTAPERVAAVVALRQLRMTAAEIAETLSMPLSTVSAVLTRHGLGRLGRLGLDPGTARRALPAGRARADRRQEARPDHPRSRRPRPRRTAALHRPPPRRRRAAARQSRLGVRPHRRRRLQPLGLRRGAGRRPKQPRRSASFAAPSPSSLATGSRPSGS
jgi:transposase